MSVVLMQWILECVSLSVQNLGPGFLVFASKDPSVVILRLNDKDAKPGEQDMIDLSCTISCVHNEIVKSLVDLTIELRPHAELCGLLSQPSFNDIEHWHPHIL